MNYKIEPMVLADGSKKKCFVFEEDNGVLGVLINGDVREFHKDICEQIDEVISGKKKQLESFGNECSWLIRPDFTFVRDKYALNDNCSEMIIDTQELRSLIDECI